MRTPERSAFCDPCKRGSISDRLAPHHSGGVNGASCQAHWPAMLAPQIGERRGGISGFVGLAPSVPDWSSEAGRIRKPALQAPMLLFRTFPT